MITDKILGMIYGYCLGDAVGLSAKINKSSINFPSEESVRGYPPNDWTCNSDMMILVLQSMTASGGQINLADIARRTKLWAAGGFAELGDKKGHGISTMLASELEHSLFETDPKKAAAEFWTRNETKPASNECLARIIPLAVSDTFSKNDAIELCLMTHADPRCVTGTVMMYSILWKLLYSDESADKILISSVKVAREHIIPANSIQNDIVSLNKIVWSDKFKSREEEFAWFVKVAYTEIIAALQLNELGKSNYIFKCVGAAVYALQVIKYAQEKKTTISFDKVMNKIASAGGDTCSNCAMAGAVLGAVIGLDKLPKKWIEAMPGANWLNQQVDLLRKPESPHIICYSHL